MAVMEIEGWVAGCELVDVGFSGVAVMATEDLMSAGGSVESSLSEMAVMGTGT